MDPKASTYFLMKLTASKFNPKAHKKKKMISNPTRKKITSPVTWGFEKAKGKGQGKSFPLTSHHRSESPAKQPIKDNKNQKCTCPEQSNMKTIFARSLVG
jgi:hypothetical protein